MRYQISDIKYQKYIYYVLLAISSLLLFSCQGHWRESIIQGLNNRGISPQLAVIITALLPIIELRGAIPLGINFYNIVWYKVVILALIGNLLPVLPILFLLDKVSKLLSHIPIFKRFFNWLFTRTRKRSKIIEEYEMIGLAIFVGIPLPGTGAWTGAVAAFLLGLKYVPSMIAIFAGVLLAAVIVTGLSLLGNLSADIVGFLWKNERLVLMESLLGICIIICIIIFILRAIYISRKKSNNKKVGM